MRKSVVGCVVVVVGLVGAVGCSGDEANSSSGATGGVGDAATGGMGTGGGTPSGGAGTTGGNVTGGAPAGGQPGQGGAVAGDGGVGGVSLGGAPAAGGGGAGASVTGGVSAGGVAAGGAGETGGVATGGTPTGGGSTGGTPTGGVATGGTPPGGASTGGVATGGAATGGNPTTGGTGGSGVTCGQNVGSSPGDSCNDEAGDECQGESCCTTLYVPGGTYNRDSHPGYPATVSSFYLDKYEVTVGRFRKFVESASWTPAEGAGAHPLIAGTGWQNGWNGNLPTAVAGAGGWDDVLACHSTEATWTPTAADNEAKAMNCVSWYDAMAFCIWDGGRLPTETEWEHAAGAGSENRRYPWGPTDPANDCVLANWGECDPDEVRPVGSSPAGAGCWGHQDLAGNVWEWNFDWYAPYPVSCSDCANIVEASYRVRRGGSFIETATSLRSAYRLYNHAVSRFFAIGLRCARIQ